MDVQDEIRAFAQDEPDLIAVYLFGSRASGGAHRHSDVNVAVLLPADLTREARFDRRRG
jgi:predicted nucleotidyltransferase